jgi:hypothetical protein
MGDAVLAAAVITPVDPTRAVGVDPLATIAAECRSAGVMPVPVVALDADALEVEPPAGVPVPVPVLPDGLADPGLLELGAPPGVPVPLVSAAGVVEPTVSAETVVLGDPVLAPEEPEPFVPPPVVVPPALEPVAPVELDELVVPPAVEEPAAPVSGAACARPDPFANAAPTPSVTAPAPNQVETWGWRPGV